MRSGGSRLNSSPGMNRFSMLSCLAALIVSYVSMPFARHIRYGILLESILITLVLLFSILAVGHSRKVLAWAIVLAVPAFVVKWAHYVCPGVIPHQYFYIFAAIFCLFVVAQMMRFIFRASRIDHEVMCAGIAAYLLLALLWSFGYNFIAEIDPAAFAFTNGPTPARVMEGFTGLYFSFSTLNTVGYGDIVPVSSVARMLAMTEATLGMFYMAMMISRLVSLYSSQPKAAAR